MATTISITQTTSEDGWYCEGPCAGRESNTGRPVFLIESSEGHEYWRCWECLQGNLDGGHDDCANCGENLTNSRAFCDASCAMAYGYEGGHDCEENVDHDYCHDECATGDCSWCGNDASYCSADCAIANGETVSCGDCGKDRKITSQCPACEGTVARVAAASNITQPSAVTDDGAVNIDGIEFRF